MVGNTTVNNKQNTSRNPNIEIWKLPPDKNMWSNSILVIVGVAYYATRNMQRVGLLKTINEPTQ